MFLILSRPTSEEGCGVTHICYQLSGRLECYFTVILSYECCRPARATGDLTIKKGCVNF